MVEINEMFLNDGGIIHVRCRTFSESSTKCRRRHGRTENATRTWPKDRLERKQTWEIRSSQAYEDVSRELDIYTHKLRLFTLWEWFSHRPRYGRLQMNDCIVCSMNLHVQYQHSAAVVVSTRRFVYSLGTSAENFHLIFAWFYFWRLTDRHTISRDEWYVTRKRLKSISMPEEENSLQISWRSPEFLRQWRRYVLQWSMFHRIVVRDRFLPRHWEEYPWV